MQVGAYRLGGLKWTGTTGTTLHNPPPRNLHSVGGAGAAHPRYKWQCGASREAIHPADFESNGGVMDKFTQAYMEAALWTSTDESTPQGGEPMDRNYSIDDIAEETRERMQRDCTAFQNANVIPEYHHGECTDEEMAGHDFWLTRNGHGAGFWDRGLGEIGERLTEASKGYGEFSLYVSDDGKIYGS